MVVCLPQGWAFVVGYFSCVMFFLAQYLKLAQYLHKVLAQYPKLAQYCKVFLFLMKSSRFIYTNFSCWKGSVFLPNYDSVGSGSLVTRAAPCSSVKEEEPNTHAVTERKFLANRSPDRPLGGGDWTKVACRRVGEGGGGIWSIWSIQGPFPYSPEKENGSIRDWSIFKSHIFI